VQVLQAAREPQIEYTKGSGPDPPASSSLWGMKSERAAHMAVDLTGLNNAVVVGTAHR